MYATSNLGILAVFFSMTHLSTLMWGILLSDLSVGRQSILALISINVIGVLKKWGRISKGTINSLRCSEVVLYVVCAALTRLEALWPWAPYVGHAQSRDSCALSKSLILLMLIITPKMVMLVHLLLRG